MKTSLCKQWASADAIQGALGSAVNQSHRDLEPNNGKAPVTALSLSKQSMQHSRDPRRSRDPRLAASPHTQSMQQETSMIQPAVSPHQSVTILKIIIDPRDDRPLLLSHSAELTSHDPATQPVPAMISFPSGVPMHTFRVNRSVILSHTVEVTDHHHAPNSVVDPSNSTKGQPSHSGVKAREGHDDNQTMVQMMFKTALKEFVIKQIEKIRDQGHTAEEFSDFIVQKTVDKILRSEKNIPSTEETIGMYLSHSKGKIKKLIQEYFHKYKGKSLQ